MDLHTLKTIFYTLTAVAVINAAFNAWLYFSTRKHTEKPTADKNTPAVFERKLQ